MGILAPEKVTASPAVARRRRSTALNFGELKPLNAAVNTKNFSGYRDQSPKTKAKDEDAMDSDADDEDDGKIKTEDMDDDKDIVADSGMLSPDDSEQTGALAEGVRKIKVSNYSSAASSKC